LTIPEFAERIGVSERTAYRLIADGKVNRHDVGRGSKTRTRVSERELEAYLERCAIPGRRAS
jgi:excisionase family DNA binding protein